MKRLGNNDSYDICMDVPLGIQMATGLDLNRKRSNRVTKKCQLKLGLFSSKIKASILLSHSHGNFIFFSKREKNP